MRKRTCIAVILVLLMLSGCGDKWQALDVKSVKDRLVQLEHYNDDFQTFSLAGVSDIVGRINDSWMLCFYDYGDQEKALDEIIPVFLADDQKTFDVTKKANYIIYEKEAYEQNAYLLYVRVDNTFLILTGPREQKEQIQSLAKDLGYYE